MTMTVYQIGPTGAYTGASREIGDSDGFPPGWTLDTPPSVGDGEVAVHTPGGWVTAPAPAVADPEALAVLAAAQAMEDVRAAQRADLDAYNDQISTTPFAWDFTGTAGLGDDGTEYADVGVQTLQIASDKDQGNWTAVGASAILAVLSGAPTTILPMKCSANIWIQATAAQALAALVTGASGAKSLLQRQQGYLARYGVLKRANETAADNAAMVAIDITAGWD